ncbi:MAG: hypothetical protein EAX90_06785 [Candidatus Heimdallarchaeota archaeon]|nr:hypothetical protein [Candidatus Heimdallarchaeota archaeon]
MQKLVKEVMVNKIENSSIDRILEEITTKSTEFFVVENPFKTQNQVFFRKWDYIHIDDFDEYLEIWSREEIVDKTWKICNYCGQKIKAGEQFSRKCWKCKKGWYHFANEKSTAWKLVIRGEKERVLAHLLRKQYLKEAPLRKRLDFFHYSDGVFEIYEAKNKEETGLTTLDLRKTLIYPFIVHHCGFEVEKFVLIYNGELTPELLREIRKGYGKNFPFKIELCPIGEYLQINRLHVKAIQVLKTNGDYSYNIEKGFDDKIVIDLSQV